MIQSDKSESNMNIKKKLINILEFSTNRFIEIIGFIIASLSLPLFLSLATYSPEDPNFIFSGSAKVSNLLGIKGSYLSDLLFQSFGLISFLIPFSLLFSGIFIIKNKNFYLIIDNFFFIIIYVLFGSVFFSTYYDNSFWLTINGNGGFVGRYFSNMGIFNLIFVYDKFFYYIIIFFVIIIFLQSSNLKIRDLKFIFNYFKKIKFSSSNKESNVVLDQETNNYSNQESKNFSRVQEDLPFNKLSNDNIKTLKFKIPKSDILNDPEKNNFKEKDKKFTDNALLEKILLDFGVEGKIKKVSHGPVVTLNEFEPAAGVKVSKIINLSEDIARNTSSDSARISTIPGSNTIGIEIPNNFRESVYLKEIITNINFLKKDFKLPIALGKNISGIPVIGDLSSMPHLLIAGTTGSGKSVCINTIILSLLFRHTPEKCKLILIDPKMLELSTYEGIPHLLCPVITEAKKAASVLGWVVKEMESRYKLMTREGVRNIDSYNSKHKLPMPYIVVVVDEMSDLMLLAGKEVESYIQKLSQMARASGIHIIMATQRPSVDVITGTIKANFPTRISFQVSSKIDSRTILGEQGAEQLLGKGDMLYMSSANKIIRIHGPFVSDEEIEKVNNHLRSQAEPDYVDEIVKFVEANDKTENEDDTGQKDELYEEALKIVKSEGKASTSFLQRKLQIGYNRAARIVDMMEEKGVVSKANHVGKRDILK